jgi:hypothetical protein
VEAGEQFLEEEAPVVEEAVAPVVENVVARGSQLARSIQESGVVRQAGEAAHHIVAQAAARAAPAREALARVGVQVNEAVNGVFLPATKDYVGQAVNHLTLHTKEYYNAVNAALQNVETRAQAVQVLKDIGNALLNGNYP